MLSQRLANCVLAVVVLAGCVYFAAVAQGFEAAGLLASSGLPSKFFPQLMLACTAGCAIAVFYLYAVRGNAGGDDGEQVFDTPGDARRGLLMLAVALVSYAIWTRFGFIPMAVLMGPMSLLAMGVRSPKIYLTVFAVTGVVYFIFTQFLNVHFS